MKKSCSLSFITTFTRATFQSKGTGSCYYAPAVHSMLQTGDKEHFFLMFYFIFGSITAYAGDILYFNVIFTLQEVVVVQTAMY